jgi:hypothetical protein
VANSPSVITKLTSVADVLATVVGDGTYADVIQTTKVDKAGEEADATDQVDAAGQLWSNVTDDSTLVTVALNYRSVKVWQVADATERDALGSDDDLAVDDLLFQIDTTILYVCTAVLGGSSSSWTTIAATGSVAGPGASTDNAVARWDGAGGATIQNSVVVISDAGAITGVASIAVSGNVDGRDVSADGATLDAHVADIANPHATNLALALATANTTSGSSIEISNADQIVGEDGGSIEFDVGTGLVRTTDAIVDGDLEVTGKLTVAGLIDPTGLVLTSQVSAPHTPSGTEGVLWYDGSIPPVLYSTTSGGSSVVSTAATNNLGAALALDNATDGFDIEVTDGDAVYFSDAPGGNEGGILYDHPSDTLQLRAKSITAISLDGAAIKPITDGGQSLGTATLGWQCVWLDEQAAAPSSGSGHGCLYVDDTAPNELHYLDDTGLDRNISRPPVICLSPGLGSTTAASTIEATSLVPYVTLPAAGTTLISWTVALPWTAPSAASYTLRVRWAGSASSAGNVRFSASIRRWVDAESLGTLNTSASNVTVAANGTANVQQTDNLSTAFSIDSAAPGDTITITLRRLGDDGADTYAGDARVVSVELLETIA